MTVGHELHRLRRKPLDPFFSRMVEHVVDFVPALPRLGSQGTRVTVC
jgi:hypothetical protein